MQNHCVFLSKVARPTILAESGEGDPHRLPHLRTKVGGRAPRADPAMTPPSSKTNRQNPSSVNTVWGISADPACENTWSRVSLESMNRV